MINTIICVDNTTNIFFPFRPREFFKKKLSTPRAFLFPYFALQTAPKALIFIIFSTYFITFAPQLTHDPHLATVLCTRTYDLWLLRTRDLIENCHTLQSGHIQEQILLIFLCHIKNWRVGFPANVFASTYGGITVTAFHLNA